MLYFQKLLATNVQFVSAISMSISAWSFDKNHLQRCLATKICEEASFNYADLRNSNLDKAILCKTQMPSGIDNSGCKQAQIWSI